MEKVTQTRPAIFKRILLSFGASLIVMGLILWLFARLHTRQGNKVVYNHLDLLIIFITLAGGLVLNIFILKKLLTKPRKSNFIMSCILVVIAWLYIILLIASINNTYHFIQSIHYPSYMTLKIDCGNEFGCTNSQYLEFSSNLNNGLNDLNATLTKSGYSQVKSKSYSYSSGAKYLFYQNPESQNGCKYMAFNVYPGNPNKIYLGCYNQLVYKNP